jgi:hypothetical protein
VGLIFISGQAVNRHQVTDSTRVVISVYSRDAYVMIKGMKPATLDMIEGPEAWTRFRDAVKKVLTVPKSAVPNPFGKRKKKMRKAGHK